MTDHLAEQYRRFRLSHECDQLEIGAGRWEFIACGQGAQAVLLLPGALGAAETSFQYILALESAYRLVSVSYPSTMTSVAPLVRGLIDILDSRSIDRAHVIAGSYSGFIAHALVRQYPERVRSLILSGVGVPRPQRVGRTKALLLASASKPWPAMKAMLRLTNRIALARATPENNFWRDYFDGVIESMTQGDLKARLAVTIDFDTHYSFAPADLRDWGGQVLVVDSDDDHFFSAAERAAVRDLYPRARVHTFHGHGHSGTLNNAAAYIALYRDFLDRLAE